MRSDAECGYREAGCRGGGSTSAPPAAATRGDDQQRGQLPREDHAAEFRRRIPVKANLNPHILNRQTHTSYQAK